MVVSIPSGVSQYAFSMSKSFTSVAVGFAVQEGLLTIQDKLIDFFPDVLPKDAEPCGYMKELTIRDVLRMATGHVIEPSMNEEGKEKWVFQFLSSYIEKKAGEATIFIIRPAPICFLQLSRSSPE